MNAVVQTGAPLLARVEKLSHEGRGIARLGDKTVFIDGALPGETVSLRMRRQRRRFNEAEAIEIVDRSARRVQPRCAHTGLCGGCSLQHMSPEDQLQHKQDVMLEQLQHMGGTVPERMLAPVSGPPWHYRRRARLSAKWVARRGRVLVGFREKRANLVADIAGCTILHETASALPERLSALFTTLSIREHLPQVEIAVGDNAGVLVIRHLRPFSESDLESLYRFQQSCPLTICLQPAGVDSMHALDGGPLPELYYELPAHGIVIHFRPGDFTQVNFDVNRALVDRVCTLLAPGPDDDVLDLYCGLGNFSLPLARLARSVTGIEGDAGLVARAETNAVRNGLANTRFGHADLCAAPACAEVRDGAFNKLLLDPPRSGAREIVERLDPRRTKLIVYVSCNAATLARDTEILCGRAGYRLTHAGVVDMFPHTAHTECLAVFAG